MTVRAGDFAKDPAAVWAQVRDHLAGIGVLEYLHLARTQRLAWLVLIYDATVMHEGHKRYFRVYGVGRAAEAKAALEELGAASACHVLDEATHRDFRCLDDNETGLLDAGFPSGNLNRQSPEYSDLDSAYRDLSAAVRMLLAEYMRAHIRDFLTIDGETPTRQDAGEAPPGPSRAGFRWWANLLVRRQRQHRQQ